ncbi:MAG: polyphosphate kinase 1 [Candidatus Limnocylindrales bacterium]|jgi:polyphosphate kinase
MTAVRPPATRRRARPSASPVVPYINRELSWLDFNARVLHEATDDRNPLLERVRFLSIFSSNLDEFFQVRVAGLKQQVEAGHSKTAPDGRAAPEVLSEVRRKVLDLAHEHTLAFSKVRERLADEGIRIVRYDERPERHLELRRMFIDQIFPVLTPLAVDPGHPFPYISDLSLSLAVTVRDPETGERDFARIKVPEVLPRLIEVGGRTYMLLEQIIAANLDALFPGMEIVEHHLFRVTRNADLAIEEDEADDLLLAIEEELRRRRFGEAVRLEVERSMPTETRSILRRGLDLEPEDVYEVAGLLDLRALETIADLDIPELQRQPWHAVVPARLLPADEDEEADVFAVVRNGDLLVHHPYESFVGSVQRFVEQAAADPDVLTIKMTLYRTTGDSPILKALIRAAENGKQVVVLVEIKARFDEQANIVWGRTLERAGAHVVYGLVGLKTHSKVALVVRREGGGLRRYVHIGTGNYNHKTARLYVDLGMLTCDDEIGADVTDLFNFLTGLSRQREFRRLIVAPVSLRQSVEALIAGEVERQREHGDGAITMKLNALVDPGIIDVLCQASQAGVPIDLIVRAGCALRPGVEGISDNIRVRSIVGPFLEHSRILRFGSGERASHWIGSADMMDRNLDRRVEAMAPVLDPVNRARLDRILEIMLTDDRRAWELGSDERWQRVEWRLEAPTGLDTFEALKQEALASGMLERA